MSYLGGEPSLCRLHKVHNSTVSYVQSAYATPSSSSCFVTDAVTIIISYYFHCIRYTHNLTFSNTMPSGKGSRRPTINDPKRNDGGDDNSNSDNVTPNKEQHAEDGSDKSGDVQEKTELTQTDDKKPSAESSVQPKEDDAVAKARERQERFKALQSRAVSKSIFLVYSRFGTCCCCCCCCWRESNIC